MSEGSPCFNKRLRSSPEDSVKASKKFVLSKEVTMEKSDLVVMMKEVMSGLLDDKLAPLATREDIVSLKKEIIALKQENTSLKLEIDSLKKLHIKAEARIEELELLSRRNNLLFKGLNYSSSGDPNESVSAFCRELLKVDIPPDHLNAVPLGRHGGNVNRSLLVSFSNQQVRNKVLSAAKILRGSGFVVHQDLPEALRKKRSKFLLLKN